MYEQSDLRPRADRDCRLDLQVTRCNLVAGPRHILLRRLTNRLHEIAFAREGEIRPHPQHGRNSDPLEQLPRMKIHLVGKAGIAGRICRRYIVQLQRASVREDDPLSDDQRAALPERDHTVIAADQASPLRHEQDSPGRTIEHALGHLRRHQTRQIGAQASDEARRNDAAS